METLLYLKLSCLTQILIKILTQSLNKGGLVSFYAGGRVYYLYSGINVARARSAIIEINQKRSDLNENGILDIGVVSGNRK